jgi:hypothetical protein
MTDKSRTKIAVLMTTLCAAFAAGALTHEGAPVVPAPRQAQPPAHPAPRLIPYPTTDGASSD